ncbi:MAG: hypothetical protein LLG04_09855 [Parachlamydia sp.]|nr:hypothetical protein [Parachlamydia sp.]
MSSKTTAINWDAASDLLSGDLLAGDLCKPAPATTQKASGLARTTLSIFEDPKPQPLVAVNTALPPSPLVTVISPARPSHSSDLLAGNLLSSGFDLLSQPSHSQHLVGTQSLSQQVVVKQMQKGGALSLTTNVDLQNISRKIQEKALADIDRTLASINTKIEDYRLRTSDVNAELSDYTKEMIQKARQERLIVDDARIREIQQLVLLTKATVDLLFQAAKQFIELHGLKRVEMMAHYSSLIAFVFDEKLKEMDLLDRMLATTKATENHQLAIFLGYHKPFLEEENARFRNLIDYVKLTAEVQEKIEEGKRSGDDQKFNQLVSMENSLLQRYEKEGERQMALIEIQNKQELALKDSDQKAFSDKFNNDLKLRQLELSAELGQKELNNNLRIQLLEVGLKEAINARQEKVDLRKIESEEAIGLKKVEVVEKVSLQQITSEEKNTKVKWDAKKDIGIKKSEHESEVKKEEAKQTTKQVQSQESTKKVVATSNAIASIVKPVKFCSIQ